MVLPLVPLIIVTGGVITGGGGIAIGTFGGVQIRQARTQLRLHAAQYESRHVEHLESVGRTNEALSVLGLTQERALHEVIFRLRNFLERHAKQVRASEHLILDGVDGSKTRVVGMAKLDRDVAGWVRGVLGSAILGAATPAAVRIGVTQLASAGTGTAIAALSGAAAESATLAFLGGGTLAAGGGGMALGASMLNVAIAGPSLLVVGFTVKNRGAKALTEADNHRTDVEIAVADLDARDEVLNGVRKRAGELEEMLGRLVAQATASMDILESVPFDMKIHGEQLQVAMILVKAVRDIATAPVTDENGNLDGDTERLIFKYRATHTKATNV